MNTAQKYDLSEEDTVRRPLKQAFLASKIVILDQSVTNIFKYSNIQIFLIQIFIRIFVRIIFWIQIYSDIRSCQLFGYEYIRIFVRTNFQDTNRF